MLAELARKAFQYLMGRQTAYRLTFAGVHGEKVLADLAKFCRANETTFAPDARMAAVLDGRREVWLRIANHLNMPADQLWALYDGRNIE